MIVVDASAVIDVLLQKPGAADVAAVMFATDSLHAPHVLDLEVSQVVRRHALAGIISHRSGTEAIEALGKLTIERYPHEFLMLRVWALRYNFTAYDAVYVALAEALKAPLLTRDARMAAAVATHATVRLV